MRIAVIADDLTGAAEIGGIGLSYNLKVEIAREVNPDTNADMLVINTDARSKTEAEAVEITSRISEQLKALNPQLLYKKIDSVMRGHVVAEVAAQCKVMNINRALVVPANPAMGRTLVNGHYFINDLPVHETSFKHDPEFPVSHSHVLKRFDHIDETINVQPHTTTLPPQGVIIGEVATANDLTEWARQLPADTLAVGASGFFTACMDSLYPKNTKTLVQKAALNSLILYISGSTFKPSAALIQTLQNQNGPVSYMPLDLMHEEIENAEPAYDWITEISTLLKEQGKAVMAIRQNEDGNVKYQAKYLRKQMAAIVKEVFKQIAVKELVIEGGSTAAAILEELNINSIFPVQELSPGVIRNAVAPAYPDLHITLKPGSYSWSNEVWAF